MKEINADIFNLNDEQPLPVAGSLLIARPTVGDMCFGRSVIAIIDHGNEGSMGVMLNRMTNLCLSDILEGVSIPVELPVFLGGPVNTEMMFFMHDLGPSVIPETTALGDGLYIGGDFDVIKDYLQAGNDVEGHVRFFVGYSGWSVGQLADEIDRHDWVVLDGIDADYVLRSDYREMWDKAVSRFGDRYRLWHNWPLEVTDN